MSTHGPERIDDGHVPEKAATHPVPAKQPQPEKSEDIKAWLKDRGAAS